MILSLVYWNNPYIPALETALGEKIAECKNREEALKLLPEADIIITMVSEIDEEMLDAGKNLRLLLSLSAGVDKLPISLLHARGIAVCNTRGAHSVSIAEYVLGGMLAMSHHYHTYMQNQQTSLWQHILTGEDLDGQTLCIIGAGSIGREIGKKAKAFDMKVIGIKRHPEPLEYFDEVFGTDQLHEALGESDFVVLITPLNSETYQMMGAPEFEHMKSTAVFINVSRGRTVDEDSLIHALTEKQIAGAVLDVFHKEPLPPDSPFWTMKNVIVTPHNSGLTDNSARKIVGLVFENIVRYRNGRELINQIRDDEGYQ